jgi:hypothetical protein
MDPRPPASSGGMFGSLLGTTTKIASNTLMGTTWLASTAVSRVVSSHACSLLVYHISRTTFHLPLSKAETASSSYAAEQQAKRNATSNVLCTPTYFDLEQLPISEIKEKLSGDLSADLDVTLEVCY